VVPSCPSPGQTPAKQHELPGRPRPSAHVAGPGAAVGWHRVTVAAPGPAALPARYSDPGRSGQSHEVRDAPVNTIDVRLE